MRKEEIPLQKVTLLLYEGDFARLRELDPRRGASKVVRLLVRRYIQNVLEPQRAPSSRGKIA